MRHTRVVSPHSYIAADLRHDPKIRGRRGRGSTVARSTTRRSPPETSCRSLGPWSSSSSPITGCSKSYASDIRQGKWTPHVRTRPALARLVGANPPGIDGAEVVDLVAETMRREDAQYDAYLDTVHADAVECERTLAAAMTQPTHSIGNKEAVP